jgi:hypothetical protein
MIRTQIQLTEKQVQTLKRLAASRHISVAGLIRQAVDTMIKSGPLVDPEERYKRAIDIVGKFHSGKHDVSEKHDDYLLDAYGK